MGLGFRVGVFGDLIVGLGFRFRVWFLGILLWV